MKLTFLLSLGLSCALSTAAVLGQSGPAASAAAPVANVYSAQGRPAQASEPVSLASMTQLNTLLAQLETTSKSTQADLVKQRIEHWKADTASKKQALANVDSIQRNLLGALPEIITQLRAAPEDVPATFKLYRNLDALYDVLGSVVEAAGAFGSKDDLQALSNDLTGFEGTRKQIAERITGLSVAKEAEIVRLRADLKTAQAVATPPKKTVVDDNEAPKKPVVKKKAVAKPATPGATPSTAKPAAGQVQTPAPAQAPPTKPQ